MKKKPELHSNLGFFSLGKFLLSVLQNNEKVYVEEKTKAMGGSSLINRL